MTRLILAGAVLALGVGMTASAMASDQIAGKASGHVGRFHAGHAHHMKHSGRVAGMRGPETSYPGARPPSYGGFVSLGPLGITAACGTYPRGRGYCGPSNGAPIDAWSY